jgi:hypothetical protein
MAGVRRASVSQSVEECDCVEAGFDNRPRLIDRISAFVNGPSQGHEQRNVIAKAVHNGPDNAIHGREFKVNAPCGWRGISEAVGANRQ